VTKKTKKKETVDPKSGAQRGRACGGAAWNEEDSRQNNSLAAAPDAGRSDAVLDRRGIQKGATGRLMAASSRSKRPAADGPSSSHGTQRASGHGVVERVRWWIREWTSTSALARLVQLGS